MAALFAKLGKQFARETLKVEYDPKSGLCFFCRKNTAHKEAFYPVHLFKVMETQKGWGGTVNRMDGALTAVNPGKIIHYQTTTKEVPRCESCKSWHEWDKRYKTKSFIIGAVGGAALVILCVWVGWGFQPGDLSVALFTGTVGSIYGVLIGPFFAGLIAKKPRGVQVIGRHKEFPGIKQLETQDWKLGKKPNAYLFDHGELDSLEQKKKQIEVLYVFMTIGKASLPVVFGSLFFMRSGMPGQARGLFFVLLVIAAIGLCLGGVCGFVLSFLKEK
jgi:hypothetical protein